MLNMRRKVAVFTGTRADYGLLYYLIREINNDPLLELQLIVSGSHLSPEYGSTVQQIELDGFDISSRVDMLLSADSAVATVKSMGLGLIGFADSLARLAPDILILLGDRYEALAMAQACLFLHIPVFHLHGGELTFGAYDDSIRHAITKLSQYHATSTEMYRQRVIQLGEAPERVFYVGAPGLEAIVRQEHWTRGKTLAELDLPDNTNYMLLTYHSETQNIKSTKETIQNLLRVALSFKDLSLICTFPNADEGGRLIIEQLKQIQQQYPARVRLFPSLGQQRYLAAVRYAEVVIGNSSSGIIEVPSLKVPSVNIGQRQAGRLAASSVIHCEQSMDSIHAAIQSALQMDCSKVVNPYGDGHVSQRLLSIIKSVDLHTHKIFYDLPVMMDN